MRLIIFDADGTMVNSRAIILAGFKRVFSEFGLPEPEDQDILSTIGLSLDLVFSQLLDRPVDEEIKRMGLRYKANSVILQKDPALHSPLYHGIDETIRELSRIDSNLIGIATGKSRRGLNEMISRFGYDQHVVVSRTADDCPSKPHPAMILECCEATGCDPANTMMVGDSNYDMIMANEAGAKALGVSWGYQPVESLTRSGAHAIVDYPLALANAIDELFEKKV